MVKKPYVMNHGWRKKSITLGWRDSNDKNDSNDNNDKNSFRCKFRCSKIFLSNMGKRDLESHMQGVRHKQKTPVKSGCIFKL